jgi:hypothetical protein
MSEKEFRRLYELARWTLSLKVNGANLNASYEVARLIFREEYVDMPLGQLYGIVHYARQWINLPSNFLTLIISKVGSGRIGFHPFLFLSPLFAFNGKQQRWGGKISLMKKIRK